MFRCFKCDENEGGQGGSTWNGKAGLPKMMMILEKITFHEAVKKIYAESGFPDPPFIKQDAPQELIPKEAIPLTKAHPTDPTVKYMLKRWMSHLIPYSYVCMTGQYRGRIILSTNQHGILTGFEAKTYTKQKPPSLFPDYQDTWSSFYTTRSWDWSKDFLVLTESIFDAETLGVNAVGLYGSSLKDGQFAELLTSKARGIKKLVWLLDWDAWKKQSKMILARTLGIFDNYVCNLPEGTDPNALGRDKCWDLVSKAELVRDEFDLVELSVKFGRF